MVGQVVLLRRPKVDQHRLRRTPGDVVGPPHKDVPRLDITMQDAGSVNDFHAFQERLYHGAQIGFGERLARRLALPQKLRQWQPVIVIHDKIRGAVPFKIVQAGNDARLVPELPKLFRLVSETPETVLESVVGLRVEWMHAGIVVVPHRQFAREEFLDGEQPVGIRPVPRQVDDAEAAAAQFRVDDVVVHYRARRQGVQRTAWGLPRHTAIFSLISTS